MPDANEPTSDELNLITHLGRLNRLVEAGLSPAEAAGKVLGPESADEYVARNQQAMAAMEQRLLSREYLETYAAIEAEPDPIRRSRMRADLKRANFAALDMQAVHRTIAARNRQLKAEGLLPPEAPI